MKQSFSADEIKDLAAKGYTVHLMAEKLNADEAALEEFYIDCFAKDSASFPLRLMVTKKWLHEKLQTTSVSQLSRTLNTSISTIQRLMRSYGVENPKLYNILTPEVLYSLYVTQKLTDKEIAEKYNCSIESVKKLKSKYKISASDRYVAEEEISIEFFHTLYCKYGFTLAQIAKMLNCTRNHVLTVLRPRFISQGGKLAEDLKKRWVHTNFDSLNTLLMDTVEPTVLFELLREYPYAKVAEMYHIIPKADRDMELFSEEWISYWLQKLNQKQISEQFHVGYTSILALRQKAALPSPDPQKKLDIDLIKKLYLDSAWSDRRIAKMLGVSKYSIMQARKANNIMKSQRLPLHIRLDKKEFERLYLSEQLTLSQISELYGVPLYQVSDLRHKYGKENPKILTHKALGTGEERLQFLKKKLRFTGLK